MSGPANRRNRSRTSNCRTTPTVDVAIEGLAALADSGEQVRAVVDDRIAPIHRRQTGTTGALFELTRA